MYDKIVLFDLFDTIINKIYFDYDKVLEYIYENHIDKSVHMYEDLKRHSKDYQAQYLLDRSKTYKEYSFTHQLNYYKNNLATINLEDLDKIEWTILKLFRKDEIDENIKEVLEYLDAWGYEMYIVSNSMFSAKALKRYLEDFELAHFFKNIISSADYGIRKPSIDFFKCVEKEINTLFSPSVHFIGNTFTKDVLGAKNAGLTPLYYIANEKQERGECDFVFTNFLEVKEYFETNFIYVNSIKQNSYTDGYGVRTVVFLQGCETCCEGCQNISTWAKKNNIRFSITSLLEEIEKLSINKKITFSGGEPLLQEKALLNIFKHLNGYDICLYTSFDNKDISNQIKKYLKYIKVGKFDLSKKTTTQAFVGSTNQQFLLVDKESL